jgi:hypothetical protein
MVSCLKIVSRNAELDLALADDRAAGLLPGTGKRERG